MAEMMGLNRTKLWALFRVRGKLTLRQFSREPGKIVGAILAAIVVVPLVLGAAVGTTIGYFRLPEPWPQGRVPPPAGGSDLLRGVSAAAPMEWDRNVLAPKEGAMGEGAQGGD